MFRSACSSAFQNIYTLTEDCNIFTQVNVNSVDLGQTAQTHRLVRILYIFFFTGSYIDLSALEVSEQNDDEDSTKYFFNLYCV